MTDDAGEPDEGDGDLDERDEVVANALALGWTHAEAAALVGLSAKWVQRRLVDERFKAEVRRRRTAQLEAVTAQLAAVGPRAVAVLLETMESDDPSVRVRSAVAVLGSITKLGRQFEVEQRVADLEALTQRHLHRGEGVSS